jgi:hypothetical protein
MGFNQSSVVSNATTSSKTGDLFSAVLAGFGIWTTPSPAAKPQPVPSNVYALRPPLRVTRVKDSNPQLAGRMVISGRMADVCAELDRMAA